MKTTVTGIRIQEYQPKKERGDEGDFPQPPKPQPENIDKWNEEENKKERNPDGKPKETDDNDIFKQDDGTGKGKTTKTSNVGGVVEAGSLNDLGGDDGLDGKALGEEWETALARSSNAGNVPASVKRALNKLRRPVIDWKAELAKYIDNAVSKTKYKLPSRRFIGGGNAQYGYKRYKEDFENLVIAIDTSGSITRPMIEQFLSETMKITEEYNPQKTVILYCDTQVYTPDILEPGDEPDFNKIAGGGGTNFWPPFKWVQKNMIEAGETPTVFIYFTDGYATFPAASDYDISDYEDRCIWVFLSFDGEPYSNPQPFGERIDITLDNKEVKSI
jgi:predicted metal-dependent peptidase